MRSAFLAVASLGLASAFPAPASDNTRPWNGTLSTKEPCATVREQWLLGENNGRASDYDLQSDIIDMAQVISFVRTSPIYSVSSSQNGTALPDMYYLGGDVYRLAGSTPISPIAQINGQEVEAYLNEAEAEAEAAIVELQYQDPNANYDGLFEQSLESAKGKRPPTAFQWVSHYQGTHQ